MWFNSFRLTLTLPVPATNSESGSVLCKHVLQLINRSLETLGLLRGVTIAGILVHTNHGHNGVAFRNGGVTEIGIRTHQNGVPSCMVAWFVTGASSLLPSWNPKWSIGREVFQLTLGPRAALAAAKDKGDECN